MEIACAVWARSLLNLIYDFIDNEMKHFGRNPFHIPQFHFVNSALGMEPHDSDTHGRHWKNVFLIEEVIHEDEQGPFQKYLNNMSPVPLLMSCDEDVERVMFLSFSQHIQILEDKEASHCI